MAGGGVPGKAAGGGAEPTAGGGAKPAPVGGADTAAAGRAEPTAGRPPVRAEASGGVLEITLDRPPANAIDAATSRALYEAFARLESDPELRVGIVTAAGEHFFCAGWDLKAAAAGEDADADHGPGGFAGLTEMHGRAKPIIAAVNGIAAGAGAVIALAADFRLLAASASFSFLFTRVGLAGADMGAAYLLPRLVGYGRAMELLESVL